MQARLPRYDHDGRHVLATVRSRLSVASESDRTVKECANRPQRADNLGLEVASSCWVPCFSNICLNFSSLYKFHYRNVILQERTIRPVDGPLGKFELRKHQRDPPSTRWYRAHGRATRREKAAKERYLTPQEERSLVAHVLRMDRNGFPLPVKALCSLAMVLRQKRDHGDTGVDRSSTLCLPTLQTSLAS